MNDSLTALRFGETWSKYWPAAGNRCGSVNCSGAKSLWRRVWARRNGIRFDGALYCHPQCLEAAIRQEVFRLQNQNPAPPSANRIPLGLLMVARGKLSYDQVLTALAAQRKSGTGNIGEWFERLGFLTEQEVAEGLALQWGCPVSSSLDFNGTRHTLPLAVLGSFLMWPLHYVLANNTLYIAFGKRVDHEALYAIERMLGCRTQPCVAAPGAVARLIERLCQEPRTGEIEFRGMRDAAEMVRTATSYIARLDAEEVRMSRVGPLIWLLLKSRSTSLNLLFRLREDTQTAPNAPDLSSAGSTPERDMHEHIVSEFVSEQ